MTFQYIQLANELENKILNGDFQAWDKLPSLRKMHQESSLSITTVHQAYLELEKRGMIEAREKSGFFVRHLLRDHLQTPDLVNCNEEPCRVRVNSLARSIVEQVGNPNLKMLGNMTPDKQILPLKQFSRIFKSFNVNKMDHIFGYDRTLGCLDLRRQIAKRTLGMSQRISSADIVITSGCMEAIGLCLRAVAKPGDVIGVESPTYHGFLQLIEQNDMFALELPTDLTRGVDVAALEEKLDNHTVKACLFNPSFQNPLGFVMSPADREQLVALMNRRNIPIIEDDIFGDLHFEERRPPTLKSFDQKGLVLYCSSFSKTLAPGLQVGWAIPGKFLDRIMALKTSLALSSSKLNQYLILQFLKTGSYERQLRFIQNELKKQMCDITKAVVRYFPKDTKISSPEGGLCLWAQLNDSIDSVELHKEALHDNILLMPGVLCSSSDRYRNCIRIGCGEPLSEDLEKSIQSVGQIIYDMVV